MTFYMGGDIYPSPDPTEKRSVYEQLLELKRKYEYKLNPYTTEMPSSLDGLLDRIAWVRRQAMDAGLDIADMKIVSENPDDPYDLKVKFTFRFMSFPTILRGEDDDGQG